MLQQKIKRSLATTNNIMAVTPQRKYELLKQVGIDPDKYWIDDSGNVIDLPKDSSAMAGAKTALLNLPRTAAGVGGAALGAAGAGALGLPTGPGAVAAGLAGGFGGAALGSTIGEKIQNAIYPEDVLLAQQARSVRNPGAVQLGDLASQAVFMRPSISQTRDAVRGVRALTTMPGFANMRPAQSAALMNMGTGAAVEGGATLAQGGDLTEILKNAAIGAVFSNPTKVSQVMTRGVFSPHVADVGLRDAVNPADLLAKPTEPTVEKPREVNPELLKAFVKQQQTDAKLAQQLAALKANQEAAAKKAQIDATQGIGNEQPLPAQDFTLPPNLDSVEARFLRSQAVEPNVEVTLDPQAKPQPKPPVIAEPGTPGALDQELGIRVTKPFFDWWAKNAEENYRTRMTAGRPTGDQGQSVAGVTQGTRGADGKRDITVDKDAYTDTAPHELTHGMILDVLQHGKKGEQAEMRRLLKAAGVEEEAFVQGVGEDVVRRFMSGTPTTKTTEGGTTTTISDMSDSWIKDFGSFMRYKFGRATPEDARRIMSNTMLRGGGPKGVSKIVAKPTQEVEEKPPVVPEPPKQEVNAEEMAKTYQPVEQTAEAPFNEEFNRSMQETRDRLRVEEMNRQNAQKVEGVRGETVETPVRRPVPVEESAPAPAEPVVNLDAVGVGNEVDRPVSRTYSGESIPANVRRGRANATNERESAADLEARRIEAELAGEERPRYQEKGEDRAYHSGDLGYGNDTAIGRMGGRSTGHFGTGTYFTGKKESITGRGDRPLHEVSLKGYNLAKPASDAAADSLHNGLRTVNALVDRFDSLSKLTDQFDIDETNKRMTDSASKAAREIAYATGKTVTANDVLSAAKDSVEDYNKYYAKSTYAESASTRLMRKLGFDGVDVRHLPNSDNTSRGTVVYGEKFVSRYQEKVEDQTQSPEFKNWFGSSKITKEDGTPLVVYHGSVTKGINEFDPNIDAVRPRTGPAGTYFTSDPMHASAYTRRPGAGVKDRGDLVAAYLKMESPLDITKKIAANRRKGMSYGDAKRQALLDFDPTVHDGYIFRGDGANHDEFFVTNPTQIKSASKNVGTFDPNNPDIRYQQFGPNRPTSGLPDAEGRLSASPFESASQKAARSSNPVMRTVGRALTELFPAQRAMRGKYRALVESFQNLDTKDKDLLYKILIDEYRAGKTAPGTVPARLRKEYNDVRKTLRQMRDDQIAAGQRNADGAVPGIDDSYFPNVVDPSVRKTIVDEIDSPRFRQLKKEFVDFNQAYLVNNKGFSSAKAAEEANKFFNRFIGTLNKQPVEGAFDFGAVVLPEGSRLPDNWLHSDPAEAMSQYVRDWSRSRTFHDIVQTNEDVMAGLGQEEFFVGGKKTPVKARVASPVVKDNNILHLLNEAVGIRRGSQDKITGAVGRAASAAWLANPITRSVDIATSLFKGLGMVTPSQIPGLVSNLRNLGKSYERAHDTGWIREDGNTVIGEVLGAGEAFSNGVDKFSKGLSKYTGSEKLENFGRGLSQNIGEYIARTNVVLAQSGNKRSADFLDRVAPNWRTLSEAELGTRIGQLFQGRYDATNLPQWLSDSPAAPFFSLARWNIEQWNNFREFAIKPARNGDPVPLISMLVAGLAGGVGIKEIREALSGRKSKIATLKEIAEAPEGSAKYKEAVRYLGNLAQLTGTMGIVSEMSNWGLDIVSKDMPAAASMPALEVTRDIIPRLIAAGNAMMDGEDPLTVITQVGRDIGNEHVSAYRFIEGNLGRTGVWDEAGEDLADANARRDLRVGKRLRGEPIKAAVQLPIDYSRAEERAVEKERDPVKMRQMARELKADIKSDPDKDNRGRRMRSAAASRPSYMPSKENDPKAFKEQLDFVRRTQGSEKAEDLRIRYLRDKRNADKRREIFK